MWTILFCDRSQTAHTQVRLFSSVFCAPYPPPAEQIPLIRNHVASALSLIKETPVGGPLVRAVDSSINIGCASRVFLDPMVELASSKGIKVERKTWRTWNLPLTPEQ